MSLSTMIKRLPKRPLLSAVAPAVMLTLGFGHAHTHAAPAYQQYVRVEFSGVQFDYIDDGVTDCWPENWPFCPTDTHAEMYASFAASSPSGGYVARNLANWGSEPSWCGSDRDWDAATSFGPCFKGVDGGAHEVNLPMWLTLPLADTALCATPARTKPCSGPWLKNNNVITLAIKPGQKVSVALTAKDYDSGSADDVLCNVNAQLDPFAYHADGTYVLHSPWNGDGECHVSVNISTFYQ